MDYRTLDSNFVNIHDGSGLKRNATHGWLSALIRKVGPSGTCRMSSHHKLHGKIWRILPMWTYTQHRRRVFPVGRLHTSFQSCEKRRFYASRQHLKHKGGVCTCPQCTWGPAWKNGQFVWNTGLKLRPRINIACCLNASITVTCSKAVQMKCDRVPRVRLNRQLSYRQMCLPVKLTTQMSRLNFNFLELWLGKVDNVQMCTVTHCTAMKDKQQVKRACRLTGLQTRTDVSSRAVCNIQVRVKYVFLQFVHIFLYDVFTISTSHNFPPLGWRFFSFIVICYLIPAKSFCGQSWWNKLCSKMSTH